MKLSNFNNICFLKDINLKQLLNNSINKKYYENDFTGFMYSILPNIEYLIKQLLKLNNVSTFNRDSFKDEEISLNSLLTNNKDLLVKIYGENFYVILEYFFIYEFGLNIRNALMHSEGLEYLNKQYSDWVLFIFVYLVGYGRSQI